MAITQRDTLHSGNRLSFHIYNYSHTVFRGIRIFAVQFHDIDIGGYLTVAYIFAVEYRGGFVVFVGADYHIILYIPRFRYVELGTSRRDTDEAVIEIRRVKSEIARAGNIDIVVLVGENHIPQHRSCRERELRCFFGYNLLYLICFRIDYSYIYLTIIFVRHKVFVNLVERQVIESVAYDTESRFGT